MTCSGTTDTNGSVSFPGIETTVNGGTYWVCEVLQADWVNSDPVSSVSANGRCKAVTVAKDATTTVRLGNFQRIKIQINKTLDQLPVPAGKTFQFSIRKDASTNPAGVNGGFGTVIANGSVTGPDSTITSAEWDVVAGQQYPLNPGTYQLCESIVEGFTPSWIQGVYGVDWFSPGIQAAGGFQETENTLVCISFTVVSGDGGADNTVEFNVDNMHARLLAHDRVLEELDQLRWRRRSVRDARPDDQRRHPQRDHVRRRRRLQRQRVA